MKNRITSDNIQSLKSNEIFVFGSNLSGIHGGGAAKLAMDKFKAQFGVGIGYTGQCFAIPTKSKNIERTLTIEEIKSYVNGFIQVANEDDQFIYFVTEIGCGLAGYEPKDIAPLFKEAIHIKNVHLPKRFWKELGY